MFFQRKSSKKLKDSDGSKKKDKSSRGKSDFFDRAKGGLGLFAESPKSSKNGESAEIIQEDATAGIETILHQGSNILDKAKAAIEGLPEASRPKEPEQESTEEGNKDMEAFTSALDKVKSSPEIMEKVTSVLDKVKNNPEMIEKVKEQVINIADVLHLGKQESKEKEPVAEEKTKGEATEKTDGPSVIKQAVEEIQAVVAAVQQQTARGETEIPVETTAETPVEGEKPGEAKPEVKKDDPMTRVDLMGFFAVVFEKFCSPAIERCCSPASKKKD